MVLIHVKPSGDVTLRIPLLQLTISAIKVQSFYEKLFAFANESNPAIS